MGSLKTLAQITDILKNNNGQIQQMEKQYSLIISLLKAKIGKEEVAEVFVRVISEGQVNFVHYK